MISFYNCFPLSSRVLLASLPTSSLVLPKMNWVTLLCCWIKNVPPFPISNGLWASSHCHGFEICTYFYTNTLWPSWKNEISRQIYFGAKKLLKSRYSFSKYTFSMNCLKSSHICTPHKMASLLFSIYSIYLYKSREKEKELPSARSLPRCYTYSYISAFQNHVYFQTHR